MSIRQLFGSPKCTVETTQIGLQFQKVEKVAHFSPGAPGGVPQGAKSTGMKQLGAGVTHLCKQGITL